jgi:hypothetical protein
MGQSSAFALPKLSDCNGCGEQTSAGAAATDGNAPKAVATERALPRLVDARNRTLIYPDDRLAIRAPHTWTVSDGEVRRPSVVWPSRRLRYGAPFAD